MLRFIEAYPNYRTLGIQAGIYKGSFDEDECAVDLDSDESQLVITYFISFNANANNLSDSILQALLKVDIAFCQIGL